MPPCYALPVLHVGFQEYVDIFFDQIGSQIPFHIRTKHHNPSCKTNARTEDFHSLHRSKVSKFDGIRIRLYARLFKTLEKQRFFPYCILSYSRAFYFRRKKVKKKQSSGSFFSKKMFLVVCDGFSGIRWLSWSTRICEDVCGVRWGPLECDDTPGVRCHMSMRGRKSPDRWILGHNPPNSTERMLVVVN